MHGAVLLVNDTWHMSSGLPDTRAGTNTPSDEYDTYRDTGWRIRYVSRIHFFSEAKLGNG